MKYEGIGLAGELVDLGLPIRVKLSMDEEAPADGFSGVFPGGSNVPDLQYLNVYDEDGNLVFGGIVDQQSLQIGGDGALLQIVGRSKAALLLDNEAKPQTYINPSLGKLFANHAAPYGLPGFVGKTSDFQWTYVISKGRSEWQVLEDFCLFCIGVIPRVTPEGVLDATQAAVPESLRFSNTDGIRFSELRHNRYPCKQISQLWIQSSLGSGYNNNVVDHSAIQNGVRRTRYVTSANWQGQRRLKLARRRSDELVLVCPGYFSGKPGMRATVHCGDGTVYTNFSVAKLAYTLDGQGERCTVTLRTDL